MRSSIVIRVSLLLACGGLLGACREATGPSQSIVVSVGVVSPFVALVGETRDGLIWRCSVELTATARGTGSALWRNATFRMYTQAEPDVAIRSQSFLASSIQRSWGVMESGEIAAGDQQRSGWEFTGPEPFTIDADFGYQPVGTESVFRATTGLRCGSLFGVEGG
jgi:hypothetical protein